MVASFGAIDVVVAQRYEDDEDDEDDELVVVRSVGRLKSSLSILSTRHVDFFGER